MSIWMMRIAWLGSYALLLLLLLLLLLQAVQQQQQTVTQTQQQQQLRQARAVQQQQHQQHQRRQVSCAAPAAAASICRPLAAADLAGAQLCLRCIRCCESRSWQQLASRLAAAAAGLAVGWVRGRRELRMWAAMRLLAGLALLLVTMLTLHR
jgi:hypothetical protein